MRISVAVQVCLHPALIDILHNNHSDLSYQGLPKCQKQLYNKLFKFKSKYQGKLGKLIKPFQWDMICPANCQTDSSALDVTTVVILIIHLVNITPPKGGWNIKEPKSGDQSLASFIIMARMLRNAISHYNACKLSKDKFEELWSQARVTLLGLRYQNIKLFDNLKTENLDGYKSEQNKVLSRYEDAISLAVEHCKNECENRKRKIETDVDNFSQEMKVMKDDIHDLQNQTHHSASNTSITNLYVINSSFDEDVGSGDANLGMYIYIT
jgi:hypothetical protein